LDGGDDVHPIAKGEDVPTVAVTDQAAIGFLISAGRRTRGEWAWLRLTLRRRELRV
jgi:hypothetical protein